MPPPADPSGAPRKAERLGRDAWVAAARATLIASGEARIKVDPLARAMGVTTGSFYWHFKDRQALVDAVLDDWETNSSSAMFQAVASETDPVRQFERLVHVWVEENEYSPAYDAAVRDWARNSSAAEAAVRRVDERRIALLHGIFSALGHGEPDAFIRARITYFHQVGYYAMHISESREQRLALLPAYIAVLLGPGPRA